MLKKIKEYAKEAADDALKDLVKSAVTGFIMALVAGATTIFSSFIPNEFKQDDVLFVIVSLSFIFGMGILLFIRASRWSLRVACIAIIAASVFGAHAYYINGLLHGLPKQTDNIVLVVLPDSIQRFESQSHLLNLEARLPKSVDGSNVSANLHFIRTPLAGHLYLDNPRFSPSFLSRYIASARHILGVIEVIEDQEEFILKTSVPAVEKYLDLGLSWMDVQAQGQYPYQVSGTARVDQYGFNVELRNTAHTLHEGFHTINLTLGTHISTLGVNQESLKRYRMLPIETNIRTTPENIERGLYFTANMSLAAYAKLQGDHEALCQHIQQYSDYESESSQSSFLSHLNMLDNVFCLLEHNQLLLESKFSTMPPNDQQDVLKALFIRAIATSEYDNKLKKLNFISASDLQNIQAIREQCRLQEKLDDITFIDNCLMSHVTDSLSGYTLLVKQVAAKKLQTEHTRYFALTGGGTPSSRQFVFQRWQVLDDYSDEGICERIVNLFMLSFQQSLQLMFQQGLAVTVEQLMREVSGMYQAADCSGAKLEKLDIHRLLTDETLRQEITASLEKIFNIDALATKQVGEVVGELLRLLKQVEGRLFLSPLENTLSLSKTYDIAAVSNFTKKLLLSILGGDQQQHSVFDQDEVIESIAFVVNAIDFTMKFDELDNVLGQAIKSSEENNQVRQFVTKLHQQLSRYFLDPYLPEVVALLLYGSDVQAFIDYTLEPREQPNNVHLLYLYRVLNEQWNQQQPIEGTLEYIEQYYPKETASPRFMHYDLLANVQKGNTQVVIALAQQLISRDVYIPGLFYQYVLSSVQNDSHNVQSCQQLPSSNYPAWFEYLLLKESQQVLIHLTSKGFVPEFWSRYYQLNTLAIHDDIVKQQEQFKYFLQEYLIAYASSDMKDKDKKPLYQAMLSARQNCQI